MMNDDGGCDDALIPLINNYHFPYVCLFRDMRSFTISYPPEEENLPMVFYTIILDTPSHFFPKESFITKTIGMEDDAANVSKRERCLKIFRCSPIGTESPMDVL